MSGVGYQHTVSTEAICAGVGVHSGERARMVLKPAPAGSGIRFRRVDIRDGRDPWVAARGEDVSDVRLGTTLCNASGVSVAVVEHLLAACAGMGIDNLVVEIDAGEVPILDGSAAIFCELLQSAGPKRQAAPRRRIRILETVEVVDGVKWARLSPVAGGELTLRARIDFESRAIGVQEMAIRLTPGLFARDVAFARTFGFARDVEALKAIGLARGGSLDNAVVVEGDTIVNPEGLRAEDEFIRHKLLDAIGDLMLAGGPIAGAYDANQPGHALNNALVRRLMARPDAWCWESDAPAASAAALEARA